MAMLQPDSMKAETTSLPGSRRNPLEVFTSMFRSKRFWNPSRSHSADSNSPSSPRRSLRPVGGPSMTQSSDRIWDLLSTSPVRARNLEQDMEALRQSRHDNPFLQQQMERFSLQDDPADERQLLFPDEDVDYQDLHKHLIRSPPPQFPQDVAQFVFPALPPPEDDSMIEVDLMGRPEPFGIQQECPQQRQDIELPTGDQASRAQGSPWF